MEIENIKDERLKSDNFVVIEYLHDSTRSYRRRYSKWHDDPYEHLRSCALVDVLECLKEGDHVEYIIPYLRNNIQNDRGYNPNILLELDVMGFILPHIDIESDQFQIINAIELTMVVLSECDIPPDSAFENPQLAENIVTIIQELEREKENTEERSLFYKLYTSVMKLLALLLDNETVGPVFSENLAGPELISAIADKEILEDFDLSGQTNRNLRVEKIEAIKSTFCALHAITRYMEPSDLDVFEDLIPVLIQWLDPDGGINACLKENSRSGILEENFMALREQDAMFLASILENDGNRAKATGADFIPVVLDLIWKQKDDATAYLFECITKFCNPDDIEQLANDAFISLIRGTLDPGSKDDRLVKHIMQTISALCEFMWEMMWQEKLIHDVLYLFRRGTFAHKKWAATPLIMFGKICSKECRLKMVKKEFIENLCVIVVEMNPEMQISAMETLLVFLDELENHEYLEKYSCIEELQELCTSENDEVAELANTLFQKYGEICASFSTFYADL